MDSVNSSGLADFAPWNCGSVKLEASAPLASALLDTAVELPDRDNEERGERVDRCPSLCIAACTSPGVDGR